jgi:hypothetical protein
VNEAVTIHAHANALDHFYDLQKAKQHALLKQNGYTVSVSVE